MTEDPGADMALFAEIERVVHGARGGETTVYSLSRPISPALRAAMTAWLRTLPTGLGEAELSERGRAWYERGGWSLDEPERSDPLPTVPTWPEFLRGCLHYRQSLDTELPDAPRSDAPFRP